MDNIVYVGGKSVMEYVLAVITKFNNDFDEVVIKARGKAISRTVDVAEVVRNRFMTDAKVKDIIIGTANVVNEEGRSENNQQTSVRSP